MRCQRAPRRRMVLWVVPGCLKKRCTGVLVQADKGLIPGLWVYLRVH